MSWNKIIECVPNFSEGRDLEKIDQIVAPFRSKAGVKLLDYSNDEDHNRLVVTLVGELEALCEAVVEAVGVAVRLIDLNQHTGQHPRMGAVDVIPFIPIRNTSVEEAIELSKKVAAKVAELYNLPVFLYEKSATAPHRENLASVRKGEFEGMAEKIKLPEWQPDFGPAERHPTAGTVAIGARMPLVAYNRRELAIISLVGGFLAPFIVSSGEGSYLVLFTYVSILNLGMFGLSIYKKWGELPMISFVFTWLIMGIFLLFSYTSSSTVISGHLFLFTTLFYFIFLLPVFSILRGEDMRTMSRGLVFVIITNNFIYLLSGALFLRNMGWSFKASGLLSLFIALVNLGLVLWLWKSRKDYKFLVYTTLGLVLTFVSITVPIQLDGNYITLVWASEMVLLLWLYIKSRIRVYEYAAKILVGLTFISYLMDIYNVVMHEHHAVSTIFLNSSFATSLFVGLAMGAFALLMGYYRPFFSTARQLKYGFWNPFMLFVSVAILYYTFMMEFHLHFEGATRSGAMFLFTAIAISSVCYAFRKRFPITQCLTFYMLAIGINTLVYIINIWGDQWENMAFVPVVLRWFTAAFVIANICYVARQYYLLIGIKSRFTIYLNILVTLLWVTMVRSFLWQVGVDDFSAGLSLSLSIAGFVQMGLGMRLHQKVMRMISLSTFGIVLLKLVFDDLWAMPTIGKIIVFIILGLILLILSFLYQKLKDVLFKNDEDEVS